MRDGLKVNLHKIFLACTETAYLRYRVFREEIAPQPNKVKYILALKPPSTSKALKSVLEKVQYYRDMWPRRSHILLPLTDASSTKKIVWTEEMDKAFIQMEQITAQETSLALPDYTQLFQIYTNASGYQFRGVIQQDG